ncbi:MAG: hypothetical protein IJ563_10110 [Selenomonadaceae bacterium]|nr:hypothetical protein [Selenomonadaceae bacterium]
MRKIKVNKKDVDKKTKQIAKLLEELLDTHMNKHDRPKTIEIAEKILSLNPKDAYPMEKVTSIFVDLNETDRAAKASDYMEKRFPPSGYRTFLKSRVYDLRRDYEGCIKYAEEALTIPGSSLLTIMMIHNILGHAYRYVGDAPKSIEHYYKSSVNDISAYKSDPDTYRYLFNIKCDDYSNYLFSLHNVNVTREELFDAICKYNDIFKDFEIYQHDRLTHPKHDKIRIGYISPDIRRHVVAFFSYAFYKCYDKSKFEVYCYPKCQEDRASQEFKNGVDGWRNILFDTPKQAAEKIKNDEIDILVDLSGHTANNTLQVMAYKPAPIQISAIGWFNSTGLKTIDYFLCDKFTDPEGLNDDFFSEKILRLQHSHFCYMWHDAPTVVNPAPCTKNKYITFVSFNNFAKVTDETLRAWSKIINSVPNSKLYVKGKAFRTTYGINDAKQRMEAAGLPLDRMIIEADEQDYLKKYSQTDIALDTFPYPGGGTTCDALYMGVPVITLIGERHNSRFGYSLLHNIGLDELCAHSEEEYIKIAIDLANNWDRIREYHLTLRRRMRQSPIMNDIIYMAEVENAYEKIYNAWINGEALPDFPQDEPTPTAEDAENYYKRALSYINAEEGFYDNKFKDQVNIKRAVYWLERAAEVKDNQNKNLADIYLLLAKSRQHLNNYAGAYEAVCNVPNYINLNNNDDNDASVSESQNNVAEVDAKFVKRYHTIRAEIAQLNGNNTDAVENYDRAVGLTSNNLGEQADLFSRTINALHFLDISTDDLISSNFEYQNLFKHITPYNRFNKVDGIIKGERRMKVGYLSPHFKKSDTFAFVYGIFACHNKNRYEVTAYALNAEEDPFTAAIKPVVEHFENVSNLTIERLAQKIRNDNIDILVDLAGHCANTGLSALAYRPAPVQISGVGALSSTGLDNVNFFITDKLLDPPNQHDKWFKERLIYMPSQIAYASNSEAPKPIPAPSLEFNHVTFGAFHSYKRINDDMLKVWKEILNRVPDSKLIMRAEEFVSDSLVDSAYTRMKDIGFNMDNVLFQPLLNDYIKNFLQIDIALDTFPASDAASTFDALYMGVPVITFYTDRRDTRTAFGILNSVGLGDFAVNDINEYINRAVTLANDKEGLNLLHKNLRNMVQKSEAVQPNHYVKVLEQYYEYIIRQL